MKKFFFLAVSTITALLLISVVIPQRDEEAIKDGTLVVANKSGDDISLIDRATGKTIKMLPAGLQPHEAEVSPDGKFAVVSNYGERGNPGNTLTVYNIVKGEVVKTIDLGDNTRPHGMDWLNGTSKILVTTEGSNSLLLIDIESGEIENRMNTQQEVSHMVAATPDAKFAFVPSIRTGNVTVFNLETGELMKQLYSGEGAEGVDVSPDGEELWVTNRAENTIAVFSIERMELIKKIECGDFPIRGKFSPNGEYFVVSNARSGDVAVFNAREKKLIKKIKLTPPVPEDEDPERFFSEFEGTSVPIGLVIPDNNYVYVANTRSDVVTVIDLNRMEITSHFEAGKEPDGINYSPLKPGK